jgi:hypothetical protein
MMRLCLVTFTLLLVSVSFALTQGTTAAQNAHVDSSEAGRSIQQGTLFSSQEGRFSIIIPPGFPTFSQTTQKASDDVVTQFFSSATARGASVLAYTDLPPRSFVGRTAQKILEDGRDGALESGKATLEKQQQTTLQGYPSLIMYSSATIEGRPVYVRFQFVLAQPRTYQVGFLTYDRAMLDGPEIQAYFKSFRILTGAAAPH